MSYTQEELLKETPVECIRETLRWLQHVTREGGDHRVVAAYLHAHPAIDGMEGIAGALACLIWKSDPELIRQQAFPTAAYVRAIQKLFPPQDTDGEIEGVIERWADLRAEMAAGIR